MSLGVGRWSLSPRFRLHSPNLAKRDYIPLGGHVKGTPSVIVSTSSSGSGVSVVELRDLEFPVILLPCSRATRTATVTPRLSSVKGGGELLCLRPLVLYAVSTSASDPEGCGLWLPYWSSRSSSVQEYAKGSVALPIVNRSNK